VVTVEGQDYRFTYRVNGVAKVIRGMGYNPMYATLDREERSRRYDRDFALMRQASVNTIFGWINAEFDRLTLDKAHQYGLGVAMPYYLDPALDYASREVRESLTRDILQWVATYKDHPSLRIWHIGNEVLHKLVYPSWLPKQNPPEAVARARAFASFYAGLIDQVRKADPDHPVLYSGAEDGYLKWIRDAFRASPKQRTWVIYGANIYTAKLPEVVDRWPDYQLGVPLLITEFAPAGLGAQDRPDGYREMWKIIRRGHRWTLGGAPYVWTTAGPEEVDRAFGLVDADGRPVDGSLDAIASMYRADKAAETPSPEGGLTSEAASDPAHTPGKVQ